MPSAAVRIREVRKLLGLKQEDFAALVGVSQTSVSRWEKGTQEPDFLVMYNIGKIAGVDPMKFALLDKEHDFGTEIPPRLTQIVGAISASTERENPRWELDDRVDLNFPMDVPEGYQIEAYIIQDNSCLPRFQKGSIVFVAAYNRSRNFFPKNDDISLCFIRGENKLWQNRLLRFQWERDQRISLTGLNLGASSLDWWDVDAAVVTGTALGHHAWPGAFEGFSVIGVVVASFVEEAPGRLGPLDDPDPDDT